MISSTSWQRKIQRMINDAVTMIVVLRAVKRS